MSRKDCEKLAETDLENRERRRKTRPKVRRSKLIGFRKAGQRRKSAKYYSRIGETPNRLATVPSKRATSRCQGDLTLSSRSQDNAVSR